MGKNAIVGQSGGPTSVINASLAGVFESCKNRGAEIVYGMCNGVAGLLEERVVDLSTVLTDDLDIELLKSTPSSFLGSCRYKLPDWHEDQTNQGTGRPLLCLFYVQKKTALIRKPSLMLSEILLCNKCQSISCNEKLLICRDNVNLCLRIVCGDLLEYSTAEIFLSVNVDTEDIEI